MDGRIRKVQDGVLGLLLRRRGRLSAPRWEAVVFLLFRYFARETPTCTSGHMTITKKRKTHTHQQQNIAHSELPKIITGSKITIFSSNSGQQLQSSFRGRIIWVIILAPMVRSSPETLIVPPLFRVCLGRRLRIFSGILILLAPCAERYLTSGRLVCCCGLDLVQRQNAVRPLQRCLPVFCLHAGAGQTWLSVASTPS